MSKYICIYCNKDIDINEETCIKLKEGHAHESCYENYTKENSKKSVTPVKKKKEDLKVCYFCKEKFDINSEEYYKPVINRYAHKKCYEENYSEDYEFIDEIYTVLTEKGIHYDFKQCERQRLSYIKKYSYTNEGIRNALDYFYNVQNGNPNQSCGRIGIVPYVYEEAQIYFEELNKKKKEITKYNTNIEKKEMTVPKERIVTKRFINLDEIEV